MSHPLSPSSSNVRLSPNDIKTKISSLFMLFAFNELDFNVKIAETQFASYRCSKRPPLKMV